MHKRKGVSAVGRLGVASRNGAHDGGEFGRDGDGGFVGSFYGWGILKMNMMNLFMSYLAREHRTGVNSLALSELVRVFLASGLAE